MKRQKITVLNTTACNSYDKPCIQESLLSANICEAHWYNLPVLCRGGGLGGQQAASVMGCLVSSCATDTGDQYASAIKVGKSGVQGYQNGRI